MKKITCLFLTFMLVPVVFCQAQRAHIRSHKYRNEDADAIPAPAGTVARDTHLIAWKSADTFAQNYIADPNTIADAPSYFIMDARLVTDYLLDAINIDRIKYLHVVLLEKGTAPDLSLDLALVGVDEGGNHAYIKGDNTDSFYVLACQPSVPLTGIDGTLETPVGARSGVKRIKNIFPEKMTIDDVNKATTAYNTSYSAGKKDSTAFSFLVNADDLYRYLTSDTSITHVQFLLAEDQGLITLVVAAIMTVGDKQSHIYFLNGHLKYCVMDRAMPCPECDMLDGGNSLPAPRRH